MRKIIHIDMDAFYASVEQRDQPELIGRPVIVGGAPDSRGVVAACSYEARRFGVHSAMPSATAGRLCPDAVFVKPQFEKYKEASRQIHAIFRDFTDMIEPLALDEAFLDVTHIERWQGSATLIAKEIKLRIKMATRLTASAGVSYNKFLAKIASDMDKPDGLYVITPQQGESFIEKLPIGRFFGVGKATEAKMHKLGIKTGADIKQWSREELVRKFGKHGDFYYQISRGIDNRKVNASRSRKSISNETTFANDVSDVKEMLRVLMKLAEKVSDSLQQKQLYCRTLVIKVKYSDFSQVTRSMTLSQNIRTPHTLTQEVETLLARTDADKRSVRLLGIGVGQLSNKLNEQDPENQIPLL